MCRMKRLRPVRIAVFVVIVLQSIVAVSAAAGKPSELTSLLTHRAAIAAALAQPIAACLVRRDTEHPAFHGCIDWHSAVHATWALLAYERATGDRRYASLVDNTLDPAKVAQERAYLARAPRFEMPYGRSWFLRLAIEHGRARNASALIPMADEVAASLMTWLREAGPDAWAKNYSSQSWALVNLLDYAAYRRDFGLAAEAVEFVRRGFVPIDRECDPADEREGFMATCLVRAMLVTRVLSREALASWVARFLPNLDKLAPLADPGTAHAYGLNFSRAWGLWELYAATGYPWLAASYAAHIHAGYDDRRNWSGDYRKVGHWVAQFGMFAIQPLFGGENYR